MLDYNVPGGKLNRGMAVYDVLAAMKGTEVGGAGGGGCGRGKGRE
jgi:ATP-dependent protease ClpP protease subunit